MLTKIILFYFILQIVFCVIGVTNLWLQILSYEQNQKFYNLSAERDKWFRLNNKMQNKYLAALCEVRLHLLFNKYSVQDVLKIIDEVLDT